MAGDDTYQGPREDDARKYLAHHKILELFNNLTAQLMYNRPDQPKEFLMESLEKLIKARTTKLDFPCLFDDSNIESTFGMLDPTNRGYIKLQQYKEALLSMGIPEFEQHPPGGDVDRVAYDTFLREAKNGLHETSTTFHKP